MSRPLSTPGRPPPRSGDHVAMLIRMSATVSVAPAEKATPSVLGVRGGASCLFESSSPGRRQRRTWQRLRRRLLSCGRGARCDHAVCRPKRAAGAVQTGRGGAEGGWGATGGGRAPVWNGGEQRPPDGGDCGGDADGYCTRRPCCAVRRGSGREAIHRVARQGASLAPRPRPTVASAGRQVSSSGVQWPPTWPPPGRRRQATLRIGQPASHGRRPPVRRRPTSATRTPPTSLAGRQADPSPCVRQTALALLAQTQKWRVPEVDSI